MELNQPRCLTHPADRKPDLTGMTFLGKHLVSLFYPALTCPSCHFPAYLVDAKVSIRVKVVVPRCHVLRADELGDLASTGTGGQGCYMRRMGDAGHMVGRHWFRQWGGLCRLREGGRDRLLPLLREEESRAVKVNMIITHIQFFWGNLEG